MKIVVLYDSTDDQARAILAALDAACPPDEFRLASFDAAEPLEPCIGCFGCWIRTPGVCIHRRDGGGAYLAELFDADALAIVSRIRWGGYSASVKSYADRSIPILHPFFRILNGEMHHQLRYAAAPKLLAVGYGAANEAEEATFRALAEAHGDNLGSSGGNNAFICGSGADAAESAAAGAAWIIGEARK